MSAGDLVIAALVLGAAAWLLHRSLFERRGGCHGCRSDACRSTAAQDVVRLQSRRSASQGTSRELR